MTTWDPGVNISFVQWGYWWRTIDWNANRGWPVARDFAALRLQEGNPRITMDPKEHLAVWNQDMNITGDFDIACQIVYDEVPPGTDFYTMFMQIGKHYAPNTTYKEVNWNNLVSANALNAYGAPQIRMLVRKNGVIVKNTIISLVDSDPSTSWHRIKRVGSTYYVYYSLTAPTEEDDWILIGTYTDPWMDGETLETGFTGNTGYADSYTGAYMELVEFGHWTYSIEKGGSIGPTLNPFWVNGVP